MVNKMKKVLIILGICFMLASISVASAGPLSRLKNIRNNVSTLLNVNTDEEAPLWAVGNLTGNISCESSAVASFHGYYGTGIFGNLIKSGRFMIELDEENATILRGYFIGPYIFGMINYHDIDEIPPFVGLGKYNESEFTWRIIGTYGPVSYINGSFC